MYKKIKQLIGLLILITLLALFAACGRGGEEDENGYEYDYPPDGYEIYEDNDYYPTPSPEPIVHDGIHGMISIVEYGGNRVYILGSIHIGSPEWYPLSTVVEEAMGRADAFAFEIDLSAEGGPCLCEADSCDCGCEPDVSECICLLLEMMFLPDGITLEYFLPEDVYSIFMENLNTFPIFIDAVRPLRPTTISELILYEVVAPSLGMSSEHSIDMYVFNRAQSLERPVIGLTDFNDHIAFVTGMPDEYQIATARYFTDFETTLEELQELAHIYATQNIVALAHMATTDLQEAHEAYEAGELSAGGLALARHWHYNVGNYRSDFFARQIADLLTQTQEPTTFFVTVGIAHLTREVNVFYVLEQLGFDVQRMW